MEDNKTIERIEPGKYVEFGYDLYKIDDNGEELMYQTPQDSPEQIIFGVTQGVFRPLELALEGKEAGDEFDVRMTPEEGFGTYDPEKIVELEKSLFEVEGKFDDELVKIGAMIPMLNQYGYQMIGKVVDITDSHVKMDFNHILAGKNVRLRGKVTLVRDATPEELHPAEGCGCGCHGDSCGDECGCGENHQHCGDSECGCK